jgi:hypothetical protein
LGLVAWMHVRATRAPVSPCPGRTLNYPISIFKFPINDILLIVYQYAILIPTSEGEGHMSSQYPDTLALSSRVLRVLTKLNLLMGALIMALLIASLIAEDLVMRALGVPPARFNPMLFIGMRLIMVIGICAVPVVHFILTRLLMIVETVSTGNPFVAANAARLQAIAWALLALELTHYAVGAVAASLSSAAVPLNISWGFSLTRWLAVLLLFVLARVFEQGARLREELEGTV